VKYAQGCIKNSAKKSILIPSQDDHGLNVQGVTYTICMSFRIFYLARLVGNGPPLWSSGQSSWLQIRRSGFDSRHYQKKKVVDLERGPLSLVSTTEEQLDRKVAAPV
jgi:hypothetical protein